MAAQPSDIPPKIVSPQVAAERVKTCGFEHVRPKYDRELDEDVVEVSGVSKVPEVKMRCVVQVSLDTVRYVEFPEPVSKEYWRLYFQTEDARGQTVGLTLERSGLRQWLQQHDLLGKVPHYEKGKIGDLQFARQLEGLCGPKARGVFGLFHGHIILRIGPPARSTVVDDQTLECLINLDLASGMPMWFVGNEYYEKK